MTIELGITPFIYLVSAALVALTSTYLGGKRVVDVIAVLGALCGFIAVLRLYTYVSMSGIATYRFGGFPPPLAVVYVVDEISSVLVLFTSFSLLVVTVYASELVESGLRSTYYVLSFLLATGVYGCLCTGDLFNFYVSVELLAISSYVMTGIYKENPRAVRAALIYGVAGSIVTSFLLLAVFMLYGSYGTLNMADISLKLRDPSVEVVFSGRVHGDIALTSKVSLALITWVLLFKSGIMPNHFWLPEAYRVAPLPVIVLFATSADIIGVYSFFRLYHLVFGEETLISEFRLILVNLLLFLGSASAVISALLVSRQKTIRGLVAYSSISQFSLALLGIMIGTSEAIAGATLHLITNGLGDMVVIFSVASLRHKEANLKIVSRLSYIALVTGLLNLFGVIPLLPGFWSKTYLTLGFIEVGVPQGSVVVLVSTGLCAVGYFKVILRYLGTSKSLESCSTRAGVKRTVFSQIVLLLMMLITIGLGSALLLSSELREALIRYSALATDVERYIESVLWLS